MLWTLLSNEDDRKSSIDVKVTLDNALDLVHLLTTGTDMGKEAAAGVLRLSALLDLNKAPIFQAMAVEPLVELLYASHEGVRTQVGALPSPLHGCYKYATLAGQLLHECCKYITLAEQDIAQMLQICQTRMRWSGA